MNSKKLSIIIPVYNVENYLVQCLESVYCQNIPLENYEVICVDDCSTDKSKEIIISYQKKYDNLILIEHSENRKLGNARNSGRAIAKGKYIWNVDSDDYIKENILEDILQTCEDYKLDVLVFNFYHASKESEKLNSDYPFINSEVHTGIDFINKHCLNNFGEISPVWSQVYKRDFLDQFAIYSPPNNLGEDAPYTFKALLLARRIKSITNCFYFYRLSQNSIGENFKFKPQPEHVYEKSFICTRDIYDIIKYIPQNELQIRKAYLGICKYLISIYPDYVFNMDKNDRQYFSFLCRVNFFKDLRIIRLSKKKEIFFYLFSIIIPVVGIKRFWN
jgi:glycosyltransferase involved in cell wall biosynthesis